MPNIIEVELPDGNIAEFPSDMPQEQIQTAVLGYLQNVGQYPEDVPLPDYQGSGAGFNLNEGGTQIPQGAWDEFKRDIPALAGGIAVPLAVSKIPAVQAMGPAAQRTIQAVSSGVGGVLGETGQVAKEYLMGEESAPETGVDAGKRIAGAGAEQMLFDGIGQIALKTAGYVGQAVKPKVSELSKVLAGKFQAEGGEFTAAQLSDSWWVQQLDALARGSLTGSGVFKKADTANTLAYKGMEEHLVKTISKKASTELSDDELGRLFVNNVNGGRAAHSSAASVMYQNIDDLVEAAGGIHVATGGMKSISDNALKQLDRVANVGSGDVDMRLLKQVSALPESLSFKDAHFLRSSLLSMQRDLEGVVGAGRAQRVIGDIVTDINKSMDAAAKNAGPEVSQAYASTNKFWRKGKQIFDNKFIANLINANKKNPERIGETIFRDGNVTEINAAKKALRSAARLDKNIEFDTTWHGMQSGYLQSLLGKVSDQESVVTSSRLLKTFVDRKKGRTLEQAFTKEQRDRIIEFAMIGERLQKSPEAGLGMVMNLAQAGTIAGLVGFQVIDPTDAGVILLTPRLLAHALTSPKVTAMLVSAAKTKYETTLGKQLATKLSAELVKINQEIEEQ